MKLKSVYTLTLAAILLTAFVGFAQEGQHQHHEQITVKGELVDTACYMAHPDTGKGEDHRKCASMCIKKGVPMSVLDAKGDLYLLLPDHSSEQVYEQAKEWAADQVEVTGNLVTMGGIRAIVVLQSRKLSE
jgi:hypothetical protein